MHISLDSALGRQRRLNSVGESVFQIAPNPSAGYSLRSLTGGDPAVVRVRRASDNSEKDFNSSGVSSGELVNWVNGQVVPPLDVRELVDGERTGALIPAAAAYSLRNLSASYTGDVVEVRRNTDGATLDFSAAEVADGTLTNWVNTSFADALPLDTASGAAAAYSLRNLSTSYTGNVVDVRRSSDDAEDSFTAAEVADGTLEDWVNTNTNGVFANEGFEDFSGASESGFTAHNSIGSAAATTTASPGSTGDVVVVSFDLDISEGSPALSLRTFSTGGTLASNFVIYTESGNYTATFTATTTFRSVGFTEGDAPSSFTVSNFKILNDGFVTQWYDQSGNANHATQATDASQPKIVDAGSLVSGGLDFDGTQELGKSFPSGFSGKEQSYFVKFTPTSTVGYVVELEGGIGAARSLTVEPFLRFNVTTQDYSSTILSGDSLLSLVCPNTPTTIDDYDLYYQGSLLTPDSLSAGVLAGVTSGAINIGSGSYVGRISEVITYNSDQSDKRQAIEENIGSNYGITVTSSKDGTVSTWYDQSGNANHATQADAASQPKIVDAGALLTAGVTFDGSNDHFDFTEISNSGAFSLFIASNITNNGGMVFGDNGGASNYVRYESANSVCKIANTEYDFGDSRDTSLDIINFNRDGSNSLSANRNAAAIGSPQTATGTFDINLIGVRNNDVNPITGAIKELIIYSTDQSANRTAFEANIGETYGIDLPSGVDTGYDQVDGFVETWYDQSGNGNDATQSVAGSQPKIVDAGVLLNEIKFDGVDDALVTGTLNVFALNSTSSFVVSKIMSGGDVSTAITEVGSIGDRFGNPFRYLATYGTRYDTEPAASQANALDEVQSLTSLIAGASTAIGYKNGTQFKSAVSTSTTLSYPLFIGTRFGSPDCGVSEVIYYPSDQSANRVAIETNINNQYDIY